MGVGTVVLRLHGNASLKGKRSIVKRVVNRLRNQFNASVAEVGANDDLLQAEIGLALVGNDRRVINSKLDKAMNLVDAMQLAEIVGTDMEIINL